MPSARPLQRWLEIFKMPSLRTVGNITCAIGEKLVSLCWCYRDRNHARGRFDSCPKQEKEEEEQEGLRLLARCFNCEVHPLFATIIQ
jgi:hypothetical protein